MIKLKSEVNKSQIMRELKAEAKDIYDNAYEGEYAIEQFLLGAESLFKKLRIGAVVGRREQLKAFADYAQKRVWEDGDKDLSEFVDEFLRL